MLIIGPVLGLIYASTHFSKNISSSTNRFVHLTQLHPAFPCYQRICHTSVAQELRQPRPIPPIMRTVRQSSPHCSLITAMACLTCLIPPFTLGSSRRCSRHQHVPQTTTTYHATRSRFFNSIGLFTPSTEDISPQPPNLEICHFTSN